MLFEVWCNVIILLFLDLLQILNTKTHLDIIIHDLKSNILNLTIVQNKCISISFLKIQKNLVTMCIVLNKQIDHKKISKFWRFNHWYPIFLKTLPPSIMKTKKRIGQHRFKLQTNNILNKKLSMKSFQHEFTIHNNTITQGE